VEYLVLSCEYLTGTNRIGKSSFDIKQILPTDKQLKEIMTGQLR